MSGWQMPKQKNLTVYAQTQQQSDDTQVKKNKHLQCREMAF